MSIQFYPDQSELYQSIHAAWEAGAQNVMPVAPTGSGKSVIIAQTVLDESAPSLVIVHRQELVSQLSVSLAKNGVRHRVVAPRNVVRAIQAQHIEDFGTSFVDPRAKAGVGGVDTLKNMAATDPWCQSVRLWINDEGHHVLKENKWGQVIKALPRQARGLAPTASPRRTDRKGLGRHADGLMDAMVLGKPMRWLIEHGRLCQYRLVCPPNSIPTDTVPVSASGDFSPAKLREASHKSRIVGDLVDHYFRWTPGLKGLAFAVDVEDATNIAREFRRRGAAAEVVSAKTPDTVRRHIMRRFRAGELTMLVNVDLFGEGVDIPDVDVVLLGRPTLSLIVYLQQVGRVLRTAPGKERGWIIDAVGNVLRHGLPDKHREWSLDRGEVRGSGKGASEDRVCEFCVQPYPRVFPKCPHCGNEPSVVIRGGPERVDGDLTLFDEETIARLVSERDAIDSAPIISPFIPQAAQLGQMSQHQRKQEAQQLLREAMRHWAGYHKARDRGDQEIYRRFYYKFGVDALTAQTLKTKDALALHTRIINDPLED